MAALQILATAQAIAAVCALPWARIHRFHFMQLFQGQHTRPSRPSKLGFTGAMRRLYTSKLSISRVLPNRAAPSTTRLWALMASCAWGA
ncbi:MAG: hypothetical protein CVU22_00785 [Betaproteobacteria bacterium HGW-Betaproteobacteria-16]|nr:MAG: hypothetical protein CVU22_00785 [Betaproteobacteria bacterium HGW-Betaproteobacteria-16]